MLSEIEAEIMKIIRKYVADTHHQLNISPKDIKNRFLRDRENLEEAVRLIDCFLQDAKN